MPRLRARHLCSRGTRMHNREQLNAFWGGFFSEVSEKIAAKSAVEVKTPKLGTNNIGMSRVTDSSGTRNTKPVSVVQTANPMVPSGMTGVATTQPLPPPVMISRPQ